MRRITLLFVASVLMLSKSARADEGMWLPYLIGKNYDEMRRMGLRLTKDDLYAINNASLKDAIVQFGGGCTAEVISSQGLLMTNHHCGYGYIAGLSTVTQNYLANGFWAYDKREELPAPGLSVIFLERVEDVTDRLESGVKKLKGDARDKKLEELRAAMEKDAAQNGKYVATVRDFFAGNQILLLVYKKYTDIRLVGTPPESLGKFGGNTDNWMWPRHTADFSMFRIYANANNEPAEYNVNNKPYRPKKYLPISAKGVKSGDFTMIYGYPGRTNRYEISSGVDFAINHVNPDIVKLRTERLAIMKRHMDADPAVDLMLSSNYASIANYWKYYQGQTEQLKRNRVADMKAAEEEGFIKWAAKNKNSYRGLLSQYDRAYAAYQPYVKTSVYYSEGFRASAIARMAAALEPLATAFDKNNTSPDTLKKYTNQLKSIRAFTMRSYDPGTEQDLLAATARMYYNDVPKSQLPDAYDRYIFKKFGNGNQASTFDDWAAYVVNNTFLLDSNAFNAFIQNPTANKIYNDPAAQYAISFVRNYNKYYAPRAIAFQKQKAELSKRYVQGLMEYRGGNSFYPDANSTMRISYGQVKGYSPQDAVEYDYYTTIDGMMAKYKPGDQEFDLPKEFVNLVKKRDFGRWGGPDSTLVVCFITNNDITGGNSGSPVINGNGEWVGTAFDGNWEAMSGDIAFDQKYKRTIVCDARIVLFIIEKLGKAHNLIEEMDIRY